MDGRLGPPLHEIILDFRKLAPAFGRFFEVADPSAVHRVRDEGERVEGQVCGDKLEGV